MVNIDLRKWASSTHIFRLVDPKFDRQVVAYRGEEKPGTIVIDTPNRFLYLVEGGGKVMRYGIGVGRPGFTWAGVKTVTAMRDLHIDNRSLAANLAGIISQRLVRRPCPECSTRSPEGARRSCWSASHSWVMCWRSGSEKSSRKSGSCRCPSARWMFQCTAMISTSAPHRRFIRPSCRSM